VSVEPETTKSGGSSFWTSLPGLLTAISGLLTAVLAVCAFIYQISGSGDDDPHANTQTAPDTSTPASRTTATTKAAASPTAAAGTDEPMWQGKLLFGNPGVDFDTVPPTVGGDHMDFYDVDDYRIAGLGSDARLAKWTGGGTPTAAQCANLVAREGTDTAQKYFQGAKFCLRSKDAQMIVLVTFLGPKSGAYQIDATVWAPQG
jgi:hypothetical protein